MGLVALLGILLVLYLDFRSWRAVLLLGGSLPFALRRRVERAARGRLVLQILMTALCTGLALAPIAVSGDVPGHEIEHLITIVILGGLATSMLLSLVVLPVLWHRSSAAIRRSAETLGLPFERPQRCAIDLPSRT